MLANLGFKDKKVSMFNHGHIPKKLKGFVRTGLLFLCNKILGAVASFLHFFF